MFNRFVNWIRGLFERNSTMNALGFDATVGWKEKKEWLTWLVQTGTFIQSIGGIMTGQLTLPGSGTGNNAATVNQVNAKVSKIGDTMTGDLTLAKSKLNFTFEPTPGAPTVVLNATAGNLNGTYTWRITFVTAGGETDGGTASGSIAPANQQADLSAIPLGTAGIVTQRKIYRNKATDANAWYLVYTIPDNTTTTYTDNIADASLTTIMPRTNTTSGVITGLLTPSGGMKSPWTRTVIVDSGGKGDFASIKAACDWVATKSPTSSTQWTILVCPSQLVESPFSIPDYTTVKSLTQNAAALGFNTGSAGCIILSFALTSGALITLGYQSVLDGFMIAGLDTLTDDAYMVKGTSGFVLNCFFLPMCTIASGKKLSIIYDADASGYGISCVNCGFDLECGGDVTNTSIGWTENKGWIDFAYCVAECGNASTVFLQHESSGTCEVYFCRLSALTANPFATDFVISNASGKVAVNNTPYLKKTGAGTIIHIDRMFPTLAAIREAPAASDTPTVNKGALGQTAPLQTNEDSSGTVLSRFAADGLLDGIGIQLPHIVNKAASANVRNSHNAEATTASKTMAKLKTITLTHGLVGIQRFLFDLKADGTNVASAEIRRNGTLVGTTQTDTNVAYQTKSQDITQMWNPGDACELWAMCDATLATAYVQNFRIAYDDSPTVSVAGVNS